jgi:hypothetical protein
MSEPEPKIIENMVVEYKWNKIDEFISLKI